MVVLVGTTRTGDRHAVALADRLRELGVETIYAGKVDSPQDIAALVVEERTDSVELCLAQGAGVMVLRQLLRELIAMGRREVSIVVHRVD